MTKAFENQLLHWIASLCLLLLFLPKINLLSIKNETAGIRIDDVVLLGFCLFLCLSFTLNHKKIAAIEMWVFVITLFSLVSFLINRMHVDNNPIPSKIFYTARLIEYFLFFYVGRILYHYATLDAVIKCFLILNIILMIFQKLGLIGKLTGIYHYRFDTYRVSGIASFPAEMGALLSIVFSYLLLNPSQGFLKIKWPPFLVWAWKGMRPYCLLIIFLFLIGLTGARIALAATLLIFAWYVMSKTKGYKIIAVILLSAVLLSPLLYFILQSSPIIRRSVSLLSLSNFDIIPKIWNSVNPNIELYENIHNIEGNYDLSWWIRAHKWCYALKNYLSHPEYYLQGAGPGAFSAAVDGSFIRILTENGLLGCLFYGCLFYTIYKQSKTLKWVIISFLLNMVFFDIYLSYKAMSLLFLMTGYYYASNTDNKLDNRQLI